MEISKENKMGVMPVNKLLLSMSLPMMISMLVMAMYNIVDSMFVARIPGVGENAIAALSFAFPVQSLLIASATGTGVGVNALLSRALGQKDNKTANLSATNGIFLWGLWYLLFLVLGLTIVRPFYVVQGASPETVEMGVEYLSTVLVFSFGMYTQMAFEKIMQSTGRTIYTMITQITGALINIVLDWILIFGKFGFPALGVKGAAVATVTGQIIAGILAIILNMKFNTDIHVSFKGFRPNLRVIKNILSIGIPSLLMQAVGSIMVVGMNYVLMSFKEIGETAVAVFGIYFKLNSFIFMPIFGMNNGIVPIIAYNYGAAKRDRLIKAIKLGVIYAAAIMAVGILIFQLMPDRLLMLFEASEDMLKIGVPSLKIISLSFAFAGVCIVIGSVFQALGNGIFSMIVSFARQIVVLLPSAYLLSLTGNIDNVWWAFDIAEIFSLAGTLLFFSHMYKKIIKNIGKHA